jgi:hypothetical protein
MQAVNRKNKLAYFENCSRVGPTLDNEPVKEKPRGRA